MVLLFILMQLQYIISSTLCIYDEDASNGLVSRAKKSKEVKTRNSFILF